MPVIDIGHDRTAPKPAELSRRINNLIEEYAYTLTTIEVLGALRLVEIMIAKEFTDSLEEE